MVQGNYIGTDVTGLINVGGGLGVGIASGASGNVIGGVSPGEGNLIAFNDVGVNVASGFNKPAPQGNAILTNSIFSNNRLGIDLDAIGVLPNDNLDADTGPNGLQNYPIITGVVGTQIFGVLNSTPNESFRIEFFLNDARDPSGFGEGQTFLDSLGVLTDASGNASFTFNAPSDLSGQFMSSTATRIAGNSFADTSEFSNTVLGVPVPVATPG